MTNKKYIFMLITLIWVAVIFSFSLQPGEVSGEMSGSILRKILALLMPEVLNEPEKLEIWHTVIRKCSHFIEYFILGILSVVTVRQWKLKYCVVVVVGFCIFVASIDETIQLFVNGRAGKIQDVCIDTIGAMTGMLLVCVLIRYWSKRDTTKINWGRSKI